MYIKPTQEMVETAIENGWTKDAAERGYDIFEFNNTGLLEIEKIDCAYDGVTEDIDDEDCAIEAQRSGFCKIIPVDELPENFERRYFGWVDTPENRTAIADYCKSQSCPERKE